MKKVLITIIMTAAVILNSCGYKSENISDSGFYFDTVIQITLYDKSQRYALDHCFEMAKTYENYFSDTIKDSDVSRINSNPHTPVKVHKETARLIKAGIRYSKESDGKFDISVGKLCDLWDFTDEKKVIPSEEKVYEALSGVDYKKIKQEGRQITLLDDSCAIDLGGIAKGYIADKMKEYLLSEGITSGLINLGGNVLVLDDKPDGTDYTIGVQKPFSEDGTPAVSVEVSDRSVVTSGTYQRYFKKDGKIYHHILDTKTGYPCDNGLSSVTIISDKSTDGDALSTTVFLMGLKDGMKYIESKKNTEAIFITSDNDIYYSSGMGKDISYKEY